MCGIVGMVGVGALDPVRARPEIEAMAGAIAHRGPDSDGFLLSRGVALGSRRLAIVDIEGGDQPMSDDAGSVHVVQNGEIYNHLELRRELESAGHVFRTRCDTEVLVHGYLHWGDGLVERLAGMFAIAVWDVQRSRLLLARDRMGQKPLYWTRVSDGTLLFASEAKAFVAHSAFRAVVDEGALASYLTFEYLPGEQSMFRGVRKLLPAHLAVEANGELTSRRYWELPIGEEADRPLDRTEQVEQFLASFDRSVERRLMADVPLGIFLSGGIDSSAVAASVVRQRPPESVQTFAIGFEDESFDESPWARRVAKVLGTEHHERRFDSGAMLDVLPRVTEKLDEPFGDASLLPTFLLSEFTRERVKVALGGDGGDELLMGYPTFRADLASPLFRRLPRWTRRAIRDVASRLPVDHRNFSFDFVVKSFLSAADAPDDVRHPLWLGSVVPGTSSDPLHPDLRSRFPIDRILEPARAAYREAPGNDHLQRVSFQYCRTYLAEDILLKVDRASMAASLEVRSPFLDADLVAFLGRLPRRAKLGPAGRTKVILKRAMRERLPSEILGRRKKGFGIPVARWFRGPLRGLLDELLSTRRTADAGYFDPRAVQRLIDDHLAGRRDHRKVLWTLTSFEMWRDRYGIGSR